MDCITPLSLFPARLQERHIAVQAITDHNEIWGAQALQEMMHETQGEEESPAVPLKIIVGEEITTAEGEIIGLFLQEKIPPGLSPEETVARIESQGGLVLLPHGFDPFKRHRLSPAARDRIASHFDIIEAFNARISRRRYNRAAVEWAAEHNLLTSAGSDAHTLTDVGSAWVSVPRQPINDPQDLLLALRGASPTGTWVHPWRAFLFKLWDRTRRRLRGAMGELTS